MNERPPLNGGHSAGSMLRAAREKQGLHIAALAAAIKVAPRKLDALENDRWDELPDATFTRALAQTVCRTLKVDPVPVLALLPGTDPGLLDTVSGTLNTPFSARGGRSSSAGTAAVRPMVLGGLLLLLAAVAVSLLPAGVWPGGDRAAVQPGLPAPVAAASQALQAAAVASSATAVEPVGVAVGSAASAPVSRPTTSPAMAAAASASSAASAPQRVAMGDGPVKLRALQATWISARDGNGAVLLLRQLEPGETIALGGPMPMRLTIGNAAGTELDFRGQKIDLPSRTKDNVARLELH